jgi:acyl transferase domain-containing protein
MSESRDSIESVAIIGFSGRFPGAANADQFWLNLRQGISSIHRFSDEELQALGIPPEVYQHPNYVKAGTVIDDVEMFDAEFFGFNPREAQITDPQHRVFLECAWEALEHSGHSTEPFSGLIGVFAGCGPNRYVGGLGNVDDPSKIAESFQIEIGNEKDYIATRVAYKLNLRGPSLTVQTACSTSLVAVHLAYQSLLTYQCDLALAGGVALNPRHRGGYFHEEGMIPSPDGYCRAFDAKASGTVVGQGAGIVVLRRLSEAIADGDEIHAVIRGSAVNNDGSLKVGYTAPGVTGQADVICLAQAVSGIAAGDISYVETHGTGTTLGDPIEIAALTQAFRKTTDKKSFCAIGSVKTNIGHLDTAAGVTGLIKTVLMLKHGEIVPSLHFDDPNPNIDFKNSPFYVSTRLKPWETGGAKRLAGVSSFGIGGTNAHVILEEAPERESSGPSREWHLLPLSARTRTALDAAARNLAEHLKRRPDVPLADIAYTLQTGRKAFHHRRAVVCRDTRDAIPALEDVSRASCTEPARRDILFAFSGQASEYVNMGLELYRKESRFRENIDRCAEILSPRLSMDLRDVLYPGDGREEPARDAFARQSVTQPAIFAVEYALAQLWIEWGVRPSALAGHSIGEYAAACFAGVFSLEDALGLVAARGRLMDELPEGSMIAVFLSEEDLKPFLNPRLSIALINGPALCVVSGERQAAEELADTLSRRGIESRKLKTAYAFHSHMTDAVLGRFAEELKKTALCTPRIPFVSNVTGTWIHAHEAANPDYWVRHLRGTVRFSDCAVELLKTKHAVVLEVGPGPTLSTLIQQHPHMTDGHIVLSSIPHAKEKKSDVAFILNTLGQLWQAGVEIDWPRYHSGERRHRVALPAYPFERKRYWLGGTGPEALNAASLSAPVCQSPDAVLPDGKERHGTGINVDPTSRDSVEKALKDLWQELLGVHPVERTDDFFALGGHSLVAIRLFSRLEKMFGKRLPLATLFAAPTIAQLAGLLVQTDLAPSWSPLVKIRAEGTRPPFFSIHSEGGNVLEYHALAKALNADQPFYGIQAKGLEGDRIVSVSVEDMARDYIREIRRVQPGGPYYLGGYCLGGLVAYDMARQLEAEGEAIGFLGMVSTYAPDHLKREISGLSSLRRLLFRVLERLELEWDNLSALNTREKMSYVGERIRRAWLLSTVLGERWMSALHAKLNRGPYRHTRRYILEQTRIEQSKAFYRYRPLPIKSRITLFRASHQPRSLVADPTLGWANLSEGGIVDIEIPAFHKNILKDPKVKTLATRLQVCLEEGQQPAAPARDDRTDRSPNR